MAKKQTKKARKRLRRRLAVKNFLGIAFACALIGLFFRLFIFASVRMTTNAMSPSLPEGSVALVVKNAAYERESLVYADMGASRTVRAVAGLAGDRIENSENGKILYTTDGLFLALGDAPALEEGVIPENAVLLLSTNTAEDFADSRTVGLVTENDILGEAKLTLWPLSRFFRKL